MTLTFSPSSDLALARRGPARAQPLPDGLSQVNNIIAVGSGKGGVGKSTVSSNLAVALAKRGAKVALLDADIYGPSQPLMMGSRGEKANTQNALVPPLDRHGVGFMSLGSVMPQDGPVVWRAPIALKMVQQLLFNVGWGERDYLLLDLPPGTGDIPLTLSQLAPLTGSVVVTTPQQAALGVASRGLQMFRQVNVPILGVVENMSGYLCGHCGQSNAIFKSGGGASLAQEFKVPFLGAIPLDAEVVMGSDEGLPILIKNPKSPAAAAFLHMAELLENEVARLNGAAVTGEPGELALTAEGGLTLLWPDGHRGVHSAYHLRAKCGCALCEDEITGKRKLVAAALPLDIRIQTIRPVGRYGLALEFSDGHNTGIYIFNKLRALCECTHCLGPQTPGALMV